MEDPRRAEVNARVDRLLDRISKRTGEYWEEHGQPDDAEPYQPEGEAAKRYAQAGSVHKRCVN